MTSPISQSFFPSAADCKASRSRAHELARRRFLLERDRARYRIARDECQHCACVRLNTLDFIRDLDRARNLEDVSAQVLRHVAPFGAEYVLAGTMPEVGSSYRQQLGHVLLAKWPEEWVSRYFSEGYLFQDPTICRVKAGALPFFWKELDPSLRGDPSARRVMDEATEFHLKEGFTASLVTLDGQSVGFSIAGRHLDIEPNTRAMLTMDPLLRRSRPSR